MSYNSNHELEHFISLLLKGWQCEIGFLDSMQFDICKFYFPHLRYRKFLMLLVSLFEDMYVVAIYLKSNLSHKTCFLFMTRVDFSLNEKKMIFSILMVMEHVKLKLGLFNHLLVYL